MNVAPLRILHVVIALEPGGLENGIVNLSRALDPARFESHVFCLEQAGRFRARFNPPERVHAFGKKPGFSPRAVLALHRHIRNLGPDVVHTHNLGPLIYGSLATLFGRQRPLLHGEHSELAPWELTPRRLKQRHRFYRACTAVHTVSEGLKRQLTSLQLPAGKLVAIPNGVDTARFCPDAALRAGVRARFGIPDGALVLGIVGRFGPHKRHEELLEVFSRLAPTRPELHLLLIGGSGPREEAVRHQARTSPAAERIHWCGFQERTEQFYPGLDLLVVPSVNEGLSNAVLEAMACGVPAFSHRACGSAEAITHDHDGFLGDFSTTDRLEAGLHSVLARSAEFAALGCRARARVTLQFSLQAMAGGYARLYTETAAGTAPRSTPWTS